MPPMPSGRQRWIVAVWGTRVAPVIKTRGWRPRAVAFDAMKYAQAHSADICSSSAAAGYIQHNLMSEPVQRHLQTIAWATRPSLCSTRQPARMASSRRSSSSPPSK